MYRHQATGNAQRSLRESLYKAPPDKPAGAIAEHYRTASSRRSSDPITIFSAVEGSERNLPNRGILPAHINGVFRDAQQSVVSNNTGVDVQGRNDDAYDLRTEQDSTTSLDYVLEEVLDSVDAATEVHHQAHSNSRIQHWLGEQSDLHIEKKRKCSEEEKHRIRMMTERIMRDLLGVDKSVLDIIFRKSTSENDLVETKTAKELELKIWSRWIALTKRDTATLRLPQSGPIRSSPQEDISRPRKSSLGLEKIPWGIPEDSEDEAYWNEELSLPMIFKYLKSRLFRSHTKEEADVESFAEQQQEQSVYDGVQSVSTQTETATMRTSRTTTTNSTVGHVPSLSRQALSRMSRTSRRSAVTHSRSRTSMSSSLVTVSLRTPTCSVASLRRSALGSNFWDLGSTGGASINSREVGNWSVHI